MTATAVEIAPHRYRERFGRYFAELAVGDVFEHRPGRTISETDKTWFTLLTMNTLPMHFDADYAAQFEFGRIIVYSPLTVAIMVGQSVTDVSQKAIANLGWTNVRMTAPVFVGDALMSESQVMARRESKSRTDAGIVTVVTRGFKQGGLLVCDFEPTILVARVGHPLNM